MVNVILRSGKVLQYNEATCILTHNGCIELSPDTSNDYITAIFPYEVVERVEFSRPCRIKKAKPMPKRANY